MVVVGREGKGKHFLGVRFFYRLLGPRVGKAARSGAGAGEGGRWGAVGR